MLYHLLFSNISNSIKILEEYYFFLFYYKILCYYVIQLYDTMTIILFDNK